VTSSDINPISFRLYQNLKDLCWSTNFCSKFKPGGVAQWFTTFCNRRTVNAWRFYHGLGVLSQQCFHWKNRRIACLESEWCHHQYTFCNLVARYQLVRGPEVGNHWCSPLKCTFRSSKMTGRYVCRSTFAITLVSHGWVTTVVERGDMSSFAVIGIHRTVWAVRRLLKSVTGLAFLSFGVML